MCNKQKDIKVEVCIFLTGRDEVHQCVPDPQTRLHDLISEKSPFRDNGLRYIAEGTTEQKKAIKEWKAKTAHILFVEFPLEFKGKDEEDVEKLMYEKTHGYLEEKCASVSRALLEFKFDCAGT